MASDQRRHDDNRIRTATKRLLYGSVAATAVFGGLAAAQTHHASAGTQVVAPTATDDSGSGTSSSGSGFSAPSQTFAPPVAQSGGS